MTTARQDGPAAFTVSYEGDALSEYRMPVRDLAPALLAMGQACDRSNVLLNGGRASVSLQIRATSQGSFEIALLLEQLIEQDMAFISDEMISSAASIKGLLIGGGSSGLASLIGLIKWLRNRQPKEVSRDHNSITLEFDRVRLTVPSEVLDLYKDRHLRQQIAAVIMPVDKEGIDRVVFKEDQRTLETVEKEDVQYFEQVSSGDDAPTTETIITSQLLKPASVNFRGTGKWRLSDGDRTRQYSIKDEAFLREVKEGGRRFGSGDVLTCEILVTQSLAADGELKTEYAITRVISHLPQPFQPRLTDN